MISLKQVAVLFLVSLIAFFPYFLTPTVGGFDSYYYLNALELPVSAFLLVKVAVFCALFASVVFVALLGEAVHKRNGWLAGFFVFGSLVWLFEFMKFETEQFAYPILFCSLWLFFSERKKLAVAMLVPAFMLWQGSALYIFAFALYWPALFFFCALVVLFGYSKILGLAPNFSVTENLPGWGGVLQAFTLAGFAYMPNKIRRAGWFFFALALLNAKFTIHATPFLAVGMVALWNREGKYVKMALIWGTLVIILLSMLIVPQFPPTAADTVTAQLAVREAKGTVIYNDWSTGHLVEYLGGVPWAKSGGAWPDIDCVDCIVLTRKEMECEQLNDGNALKVYRC